MRPPEDLIEEATALVWTQAHDRRSIRERLDTFTEEELRVICQLLLLALAGR